MRIKSICSLLVVFSLILGCSSTSEEKKASPPRRILDVALLKSISIDSIENVLGNQTKSEMISGFPCESEECYRKTFTNQKYEVIIDQGKIASLKIIGIPSNLYQHDQALYSLGIEIDKEPVFYSEESVRRYNVTSGLREISFFKDYILVEFF